MAFFLAGLDDVAQRAVYLRIVVVFFMSMFGYWLMRPLKMGVFVEFVRCRLSCPRVTVLLLFLARGLSLLMGRWCMLMGRCTRGGPCIGREVAATRVGAFS